MSWLDIAGRALDTFGRDVAYRYGFRDALRGKGRNPSYLSVTTLRSQEEVSNYDLGYRDGMNERLLKGEGQSG
jgi:hypothetical protein